MGEIYIYIYRKREGGERDCVCFTELMVWINPLIAMSLKTRLLEGYCKCICPLGTTFLMPPGWRLHRLGPAIAACSHILVIFFFFLSTGLCNRADLWRKMLAFYCGQPKAHLCNNHDV